MQDYIYSVIAFLAMVIHLIINKSLLPGRRVSTAVYVQRYRSFLAGLFAYYVVDALWGVLAGLGWTRALYVDTALYYIAIGMTVVMWSRYIVSYLDMDKWTARPLLWFGYALLGLYVVLLTANVFNDCVFYFDAQGGYVAGGIRMLIFYPLSAIYVLTGVFMLARVFTSRDSARRRNLVAFLFCLTMAVAIVLQIIWPLWPFYALGCLVGNCFFHVFVVEDEVAELRRAFIEREQAAKHAAELEKALDRARAAEKARTMFFSIVSHDIRTPLNAILGYSELLQAGMNDEADRNQALKSIRASGTTLLQLVDDVLDLAKIDAGKVELHPEPVRLSDLVDEVFASFSLTADEKGVKLVNETVDVPAVLLDGHRFRQILFNLVGNAVKFTDRGTVTVAASRNGDSVDVSVADTGCGIAPELMAHIFDPFVQSRDPSHSADRIEGSGLGLSICSRLVEAMGGKLGVESQVGKGSTFRIAIPGVKVADVAVASGSLGVSENLVPTLSLQDSKTPGSESNIRPKQLPRVLVVDDSSINREVLASLLAHVGVGLVGQAGDGVEALSELSAALEAGQRYDIVLTDLWMPNVNGIEFAEKLRNDSRFSSLPVYAVTADAEFLRDERNKLFTGVLLKPITYARLKEVFSNTVPRRD